MRRNIKTRHRVEKISDWVYYVGYMDRNKVLIHESSLIISQNKYITVGMTNEIIIQQMQKEEDEYWSRYQSRILKNEA